MSGETLRKVAEKYEIDFAMFGYSPAEYFSAIGLEELEASVQDFELQY